MVRGIGYNARSIIDIGSHDTAYLEWFNWIPKRDALDIEKPYSSKKVRGIKYDFFGFEVNEKYDLALCLQVLEHVPAAELFAQRLFRIAEAVLISVPYKWPQGVCKQHIHDPVDIDKLKCWTQREADYQIVVTEPLSLSPMRNRLIAYYHPPDQEFCLNEIRRNKQDKLLVLDP